MPNKELFFVIEIPPQIQNWRFLKIMERQKLPVEKDWQNKNNYSYSEFQDYMKIGSNYGVLGGNGRIIIDIDRKSPEFEAAVAAAESLGETFTIETANKGRHYYFFCQDFEQGIRLRNEVGEIRAKGMYVVGAYSVLENEKRYVPMKFVPVATTTKAEIEKAFAKWMPTSQNGEQPKESDKTRSGKEFGIVCKLIKDGKKKEEVFEEMQVYAKWSTAHQQYREHTYNAALETVKSEQVKTQPAKIEEDVPSLPFVDFSEFNQFFENTHTHLHAFNLIDKELGLIGEEYYAIKKYICYDTESQRQTTIAFPVGKDYFDNRIHNIICAGSGRGKSAIKHISKMATSQAEISAARTNIEQLVGKVRKIKKGEWKEDKSIFGEKKLLVDEGQCLLCEEDKGAAALMHEFRIAMDIFGFNQLEKKQVDTNWLRYCPETRVSFFIHDVIFPPVFFDVGTYRRFFAFELKPQKVNENAAIQNLYIENVSEQIKEYITTPAYEVFSLQFDKKTIDAIVKAIKVWNRFGLQHDNQRIRAIQKMLFFSVKQYFFRIVGILSIQKAEKIVSETTAELACFDCIQFLLKTFEVYANKSRIVLSRDVWKTSDQKEAMLFEWLHYNNALSMEKSNLSISEVQDKIGDFFGVNERQARSIFQKLRKDGYIDAKKGKHESKAWLGFEPSLDGFVEFNEDKVPTLKEYLEEIRAKYYEKPQSGERGLGNPIYIHAESLKSLSLSSSLALENRDTPPNPATLATLKPETTTLTTLEPVSTTPPAALTPSNPEACAVCGVVGVGLSLVGERWLCKPCRGKVEK
jgi:hypothetical protein